MHIVYVQRPVSEKNSFFYAMVWAPRAVNATFSGDISHPYELCDRGYSIQPCRTVPLPLHAQNDDAR